MDHDPNARFDEIGDLIKGIPGPEWRVSGMGHPVPWWAVQAARKVSVAAGAHPIVYVTGRPYSTPGFDDTDQHRAATAGRLVVFTDTFVADCAITDVEGQQNTVSVQVGIVGRRDLSKITMGNETIETLHDDAWPAKQNALLHYTGLQEPVGLLPDPTGFEDFHGRQLQAVRVFFASVVCDLAAPDTGSGSQTT